MTELSALWLPILLSSVFVFVVSSIIHMVSPWHKGDYPAVPDQDRLMDALRPFAIPPGDYMLPRPRNAHEMRTPEYLAKLKQGPVMVITVMPNGMMSMGKTMVYWLLYLVVVSLFSAYITTRALPAAADPLQIFRFIGTAAFIGYSLALWQLSIWYRRAWSITIKSTVDGLIYALVTAGTFVWLWPH